VPNSARVRVCRSGLISADRELLTVDAHASCPGHVGITGGPLRLHRSQAGHLLKPDADRAAAADVFVQAVAKTTDNRLPVIAHRGQLGSLIRPPAHAASSDSEMTMDTVLLQVTAPLENRRTATSLSPG
jgi:hypothetical protein